MARLDKLGAFELTRTAPGSASVSLGDRGARDGESM